jgi:hypothetical protein
MPRVHGCTVDIRGAAVKGFCLVNVATKKEIGTVNAGVSRIFCLPFRRRIQIESHD